MKKANADAQGFPDVRVQEEDDAVAYAREALLVVTNLFGDLGTRGLEHALLAGFVGCIVIISRQRHEGGSSGQGSVVANSRVGV